MNKHLTTSRKNALLALVLVGAGCGVIEHPHDVQAIDTSDDFGPAGGALPIAGTNPLVTAGATALPMAGGGAGGLPPLGGAPAVGGGGTAGAPPSGVTINLGGVDVPMEKAIGFIHVSNLSDSVPTRHPCRPSGS